MNRCSPAARLPKKGFSFFRLLLLFIFSATSTRRLPFVLQHVESVVLRGPARHFATVARPAVARRSPFPSNFPPEDEVVRNNYPVTSAAVELEDPDAFVRELSASVSDLSLRDSPREDTAGSSSSSSTTTERPTTTTTSLRGALRAYGLPGVVDVEGGGRCGRDEDPHGADHPPVESEYRDLFQSASHTCSTVEPSSRPRDGTAEFAALTQFRYAADGFHDLKTLAALRQTSRSLHIIPAFGAVSGSQIADGIRSGLLIKMHWNKARQKLLSKSFRQKQEVLTQQVRAPAPRTRLDGVVVRGGRRERQAEGANANLGGRRTTGTRSCAATLIPPEYVRSFADGGDPEVLAAALLPPSRANSSYSHSYSWLPSFAAACWGGCGADFHPAAASASGAANQMSAHCTTATRPVCPASLVAAALDAELPWSNGSFDPAKLPDLPTWEHIKQEPTWWNSPEVVAAAIRNGVFPVDEEECGEAWLRLPDAVRGSREVILAALRAIARMEAVDRNFGTGMREIDVGFISNGRIARRVPEVPFEWDRDVVTEALRSDPEVVTAAMIEAYVPLGADPADGIELDPEPVILSLHQWRELPARVRHEESVLLSALRFKRGFYLKGRGDWDSDEDVPEGIRGEKGVVVAALENGLLREGKQWQKLPIGLKTDEDVCDAAVDMFRSQVDRGALEWEDVPAGVMRKWEQRRREGAEEMRQRWRARDPWAWAWEEATPSSLLGLMRRRSL